jgi:hypothetical protein
VFTYYFSVVWFVPVVFFLVSFSHNFHCSRVLTPGDAVNLLCPFDSFSRWTDVFEVW